MNIDELIEEIVNESYVINDSTIEIDIDELREIVTIFIQKNYKQ